MRSGLIGGVSPNRRKFRQSKSDPAAAPRGSFDDARYSEVGVWKGSTLCSAIYGNKVRALAADNWSGFGRSKGGVLHQSSQNQDHRGAGQFFWSLIPERLITWRSVTSTFTCSMDHIGWKTNMMALAVAQLTLDKQRVLIVDMRFSGLVLVDSTVC